MAQYAQRQFEHQTIKLIETKPLDTGSYGHCPTSQKLQFGYKRVHLIQTERLGAGSYGNVFKVKCDDLPCAGKILHSTIFQSNDSRAMRQFQQECSVLSGLRHPNIVQFLGLYNTDDEAKLPVLLMELMDESLT